jgi:hypothetical protein
MIKTIKFFIFGMSWLQWLLCIIFFPLIIVTFIGMLIALDRDLEEIIDAREGRYQNSKL